MRRIREKKWIPAVILMALAAFLLAVSVPAGMVYGSHVDWFSQHTALAETIRDACLEKGTPAPAFLPLGGGSNGFQFSYYGYFRPDILIGCLLPSVPMMDILIVYMLFGYLASVLLFYRWLRENGSSRGTAVFTGILFLTAACFFQTHRQVMFINYMPFLMLALLAVKQRRTGRLTVWLFLVHIHSFYFSIACLAVAGWYWMEQEGWKNGRAYLAFIKASILSVGMASMLLVPAAAVLLEHRRDAKTVTMGDFLGMPNGTEGLLYSPYGMGLTLLVFYLLLSGLTGKKHRRSCMLYLAAGFWGPVVWILNGFLYGRPKVLIPFLPLVLLACAKILDEMRQEKAKWQLWPLPILAAAVYLQLRSRGNEAFVLAAADFLLLLAVCLRERRGRSAVAWVLLLLAPCLHFAAVNRQEEYVSREEAKAAAGMKAILHEERNGEGLKDTALQTDLYRIDSLAEPLASCNRVDVSGQQKSSMYSSITNEGYAGVYYDLLKTPIRINNRTALLPQDNPFLFRLLGIRYLLVDRDRIPSGYHAVSGNGSLVLAENTDVLPIAYTVEKTVEETMPQEQFDALPSAEQPEALTRYTIVPEGKPAAWVSRAETAAPEFADTDLPDVVKVRKTKTGYVLDVSEKSTFSLSLEEPLKGKILLLEFDVVNLSSGAVVIDINHIRNKLSRAGAAYPNGNTCFHFQLSGQNEEALSSLQITLSKGTYELKNIRWGTLARSVLTEKKYTAAEISGGEKEGKDILACEVQTAGEGYFITSIPFQNGLKIEVDGKRVPVIRVNSGFAGAGLKNGSHRIRVSFEAPGQSEGYLISAVSAVLLFGEYLLKRRRRRKL